MLEIARDDSLIAIHGLRKLDGEEGVPAHAPANPSATHHQHPGGLVRPTSFRRLLSPVTALMLAATLCLTIACSRFQAAKPKEPPTRPSDIKVEIKTGGPLIITTSTSEFQVSPTGYIRGFLLKEGKRLTLDE